jgi:hypothetical protein
MNVDGWKLARSRHHRFERKIKNESKGENPGEEGNEFAEGERTNFRFQFQKPRWR